MTLTSLPWGYCFWKMQAAQDAADRHTVIVLDKDHIQPCLLHIFLIIGLHKKTAVVLVDLWFYHEKAIDFCLSRICPNFRLSSLITLLFRPDFPPGTGIYRTDDLSQKLPVSVRLFIRGWSGS